MKYTEGAKSAKKVYTRFKKGKENVLNYADGNLFEHLL